MNDIFKRDIIKLPISLKCGGKAGKTAAGFVGENNKSFYFTGVMQI